MPKERPKQKMKIRSLLALRALPRKLGCAFNPPSLHLSIGRRCFSAASFGRQNGFVHATVKCGFPLLWPMGSLSRSRAQPASAAQTAPRTRAARAAVDR
ncbi:hypothetical protein GGD62_005956 [Bradyrhizobium sp. ERR14]|nr:hypothetical protein [Bradyrhizobium sp. ERR14]